MNPRFSSWLLKLYPLRWRAEYGKELQAILSQQPFRVAIVFDVLRSAITEQLRRPVLRFLVSLLSLSAALFLLTSLVFAEPLWRLINAPVQEILRNQKLSPPYLVADRPWEAFEVVQLGIPMLATVFALYPATLLLVSRLFAVSWGRQARRLFISFVVCSGTLFVLSLLGSCIAWQHGSLATLLNMFPDVMNTSTVSITHCFELLALSALGTAVLLQIPVFGFYWWRVQLAR